MIYIVLCILLALIMLIATVNKLRTHFNSDSKKLKKWEDWKNQELNKLN